MAAMTLGLVVAPPLSATVGVVTAAPESARVPLSKVSKLRSNAVLPPMMLTATAKPTAAPCVPIAPATVMAYSAEASDALTRTASPVKPARLPALMVLSLMRASVAPRIMLTLTAPASANFLANAPAAPTDTSSGDECADTSTLPPTSISAYSISALVRELNSLTLTEAPTATEPPAATATPPVTATSVLFSVALTVSAVASMTLRVVTTPLPSRLGST
ncbi:hypothetical protein LMG3431_02337 [Achromobacter pestifer]|uniref:Secreted protein n=1 Tax=Achromobacter pestifer TaxID=1353889 RepID=A0A6S6ZY90_9BURK|nr:hypothetical protein LMG3431_02337 [Achromobacter pestifer]